MVIQLRTQITRFWNSVHCLLQAALAFVFWPGNDFSPLDRRKMSSFQCLLAAQLCSAQLSLSPFYPPTSHANWNVNDPSITLSARLSSLQDRSRMKVLRYFFPTIDWEQTRQECCLGVLVTELTELLILSVTKFLIFWVSHFLSFS